MKVKSFKDFLIKNNINENSKFIKKAFTHSSYANEKNLNYNNERLEFLGDSILNFIVSEYLFRNFENFSEKILTKIKSFIVSNRNLSFVCQKLGINKHILIGEGELKTNGYEKTSLQADLMEAFIGALYFDKGLNFVREFIIDNIIKPAIEVLDMNTFSDPNTFLLEYSMKNYKKPPEYMLIQKKGPDHSPEFLVSISINGKELARKWGKSIKEARRNAAQSAIEILKNEKKE